jgi:hypothetical protein
MRSTDLTARTQLLNHALVGKRILWAELVEEEGYEIIRLETDRGEVIAISGHGLDFATASRTGRPERSSRRAT